MSTAVILGGGVSGLGAAYYLLRATSKFGKIILLETSDRLGGWVSTTRFPDGTIFEHGPRSVRPGTKSGKNTLGLVEELGLTDQILGVPGSSPASKNRFIYCKGQRHALPNGPKALFRAQPPFSKALLWPVLTELFAKKCVSSDESVDSFMRRRLGDDIADFAIDPMCRGIYAGDSRQLSMRAVFPDLFRFEQDYGSLIKAFWKESRGVTPPPQSAFLHKVKQERWSMWSLKKGMQQLTEAMEEVITGTKLVDIRKSTPCSGIKFLNGKIVIQTPTEEITADHVFAACSSTSLAKILPGDNDLIKNLGMIPYVSAVVANVEYDKDDMSNIPGFGHLLPSHESGPKLGVIYDSCTFPMHNRQDAPSTRFTVMMGGAWYKELLALIGKEAGDENMKDFEKLAIDILKEQLGITDTPSKLYISVQRDCIPNYSVGHFSLLDKMLQFIEQNHLPLSLIGASYRGASVNDCIYNARLEVERLTDRS